MDGYWDSLTSRSIIYKRRKAVKSMRGLLESQLWGSMSHENEIGSNWKGESEDKENSKWVKLYFVGWDIRLTVYM